MRYMRRSSAAVEPASVEREGKKMLKDLVKQMAVFVDEREKGGDTSVTVSLADLKRINEGATLLTKAHEAADSDFLEWLSEVDALLKKTE